MQKLNNAARLNLGHLRSHQRIPDASLAFKKNYNSSAKGYCSIASDIRCHLIHEPFTKKQCSC